MQSRAHIQDKYGMIKEGGGRQGGTCARTKRFGLLLMAHSPGLTSGTSKRCRIRKDGRPNRKTYRIMGGGGGAERGMNLFRNRVLWFATHGVQFRACIENK